MLQYLDGGSAVQSFLRFLLRVLGRKSFRKLSMRDHPIGLLICLSCCNVGI